MVSALELTCLLNRFTARLRFAKATKIHIYRFISFGCARNPNCGLRALLSTLMLTPSTPKTLRWSGKGNLTKAIKYRSIHDGILITSLVRRLFPAAKILHVDTRAERMSDAKDAPGQSKKSITRRRRAAPREMNETVNPLPTIS